MNSPVLFQETQRFSPWVVCAAALSRRRSSSARPDDAPDDDGLARAITVRFGLLYTDPHPRGAR